MFITNRNIFQPRILHKPELTQTLPKTNLKTIQTFTWPVLLTAVVSSWTGVQGVSPCRIPKNPDRREGFLGKKNAPPLRGLELKNRRGQIPTYQIFQDGTIFSPLMVPRS